MQSLSAKANNSGLQTRIRLDGIAKAIPPVGKTRWDTRSLQHERVDHNWNFLKADDEVSSELDGVDRAELKGVAKEIVGWRVSRKQFEETCPK